jgi:ABC-type bacteriocin/lantibiotic exporter with double-glycine peptidase domain
MVERIAVGQVEDLIAHLDRLPTSREAGARRPRRPRPATHRRPGQRWQLAIVTAIIAASSLVGLASPFLLRAVIDTAVPERNVRLLAWLVIATVAVAAVTSAFGAIQTWIRTNVGQHVLHELRTSVFTHLQRQSIAFFTRTRRGAIPHPERHRGMDPW